MKFVLATLQAIIAAMVAEDGPFDPATTDVGLALDINDRGMDTVMADVTKPQGNAGARKAVTAWSGPYRLSDGRIAYDANLVFWAAASDDDSQVVKYFYLSDHATGNTLKAFKLLDQQVELRYLGTRLSVVVRLCVDPSGRWDVSVHFNG